ncbi:cytidine deaminase [Acholeplasma laidlawii]|uniref:Cytidine deaminase n=2 Tax=Acholeplasma laidlawii TaxID=2148 RepID=A9NGS9_ACHLI|nr:cytidine deaminase [Acholeplasma laidlawii]ABX81559.1 cytidine deaminase [Acholeplasma laidlawii PG-8A]NWH09865.1 cytidine deaminase [Acholeplasma laidlawii]NWH11255.1 cytidine deaminase [Acholeplasma laidlawii]NWH13335.1 cytidine deaminase [Acholeplasma laidlawii]NWH14117.1 cytidine deaminase [Acholeplasma laidlawii]
MNLEAAKQARLKAYVPYSRFKVGAAIVLNDGTIIHGANIENSSFGLTSCAERNALFSLISQGYDPKEIKEITIIGGSKGPISPCGACRQVMSELIPKNTKIYLANLEDEIYETSVNELLPFGFDLDKDRV